MSQGDLAFIIEGEDANQAATEMQQALEQIFNQAIGLSSEELLAYGESQKASGLAKLTLILTIPSAILATLQITDRTKKNDQLQQGVSRVRQIQQHYGSNIKVVKPDGTVIEIEELISQEVIDYYWDQ